MKFLKQIGAVLSIAASFYVQAQDVSTISNAVNAYGSSDYQANAKYNALVGSTGALGGDATSLLNNPAGLGVAIAGNLSGTLLVNNYKNESQLSGNKNTYDNTLLDVNASGVASFQLLTESPWKFLNLGVNISTKNLDNYIETPGNSSIKIQKDLLDVNNNPVTGQLAYNGHGYNRLGTASKMGLGIGSNYDNKLYLGFGLNFNSVNLEQYDSAILQLDLDNSVAIYDKQYTPYSELSNGFSMNFGIIGKINNTLRLGAAIETPTWWNIERTYLESYTDNSGYISAEYFNEVRTMRTPMKATLSAALVPNKNFSINADYIIGLSKIHYREDGPAEVELNQFFDENSKSISEIKFGAEYRIKKLRLRSGYSFASNPLESINILAFDNNGGSANRNFDDLIVGKRNTFGVGLGYDFRSFFLDAAYQNVSSTYSNPFLNGYENFGSGYFSNDFDVNSDASVVSNVKNKMNNFSITLGYKF